MSMAKIRVGGVTVTEDQIYAGREVLKLVTTSFENGKRAGAEEQLKADLKGTTESNELAYQQGYADARAEMRAVADALETLRKFLIKGENDNG